MDITRITPERNRTDEINVGLEVLRRAETVKHHFDRSTDTIVVDHHLDKKMFHLCKDGFVPNTLAADGDPVDVMVVGGVPVLPGAVLRVRRNGVLEMEDEAGRAEKILGAPIARSTSVSSKVHMNRDPPKLDPDRIAHFLQTKSASPRSGFA